MPGERWHLNVGTKYFWESRPGDVKDWTEYEVLQTFGGGQKWFPGYWKPTILLSKCQLGHSTLHLILALVQEYPNRLICEADKQGLNMLQITPHVHCHHTRVSHMWFKQIFVSEEISLANNVLIDAQITSHKAKITNWQTTVQVDSIWCDDQMLSTFKEFLLSTFKELF